MQQNIFALFAAIGLIIVIKDKPLVAPSLVALEKPEPMNFWPMVGAAIKNKNFVFLLISFASLDGIFIGLGVVLDPFFAALDFNSS